MLLDNWTLNLTGFMFISKSETKKKIKNLPNFFSQPNEAFMGEIWPRLSVPFQITLRAQPWTKAIYPKPL